MKKSSSGFGRAWTPVLALAVMAWSGLPSPAEAQVASPAYAEPQ